MKRHIDEVRKKASKGPFRHNRHAKMAVESVTGRTVASFGAFYDNTLDDCGEAENTANSDLSIHCLNTHQMLLDALKRSNAKLELYHDTRTGFVGDADDIAENRKAIEAAEWVEVEG